MDLPFTSNLCRVLKMLQVDRHPSVERISKCDIEKIVGIRLHQWSKFVNIGHEVMNRTQLIEKSLIESNPLTAK
jgi:hypothetical protein